MDAIGVGLIGTGYMGKAHALAWNGVGPVFGDTPPVRLVHLAEVNAGLAAAKAREFGFARSTGDWRAVIADPHVSVVSVTTPNAFHPEMAIAVLEAGKHLWCEKPMAPTLGEAAAMLDAARRSGKAAVLGYNYIQNPAIRHIGRLIAEGAIGDVNHVRVEMDEDFMADPDATFYWKSESTSGHGALDDFAVHPLSLLKVLLGDVAKVMADQSKPYADRPLAGGGRRAVETHDIATVLLRMASGASGLIAVNRSAWGRKGRIAIQLYGSKGSILFDQERMNEFQLYVAESRPEEQGFRTVLTAPHHRPYDRFIPAPGHGLGFIDLKIIEARELIDAMAGKKARVIDFADGHRIEQTVDAMARSFAERRWVDIG